LGDRETGGGLSLPVWISFMETALRSQPVVVPSVPEGLVQVGGEWLFDEYANAGGVRSLGLGDAPANVTDEKKKILDLFRN